MSTPPADGTPSAPPRAPRRRYWIWIALGVVALLLVYRFTYMATLRVTSVVRARALSGHNVGMGEKEVILIVTADAVPDAVKFKEGDIYFSAGGKQYGCFTTIVSIPGTAKLFSVFPRQVVAATTVPGDVVEGTLHLGPDVPALPFKTAAAVVDVTVMPNE
jgi:hypothetical protein